MVPRRALLAAAICLGATARPAERIPAGYREAVSPVGETDSTALRMATRWRSTGAGSALASIGGLPPVPGKLTLTGGSMVFHPDAGTAPLAYPLYRIRRNAAQVLIRRPAVSLLDVASLGRDTVYLFHLDGAVIETATPGVLRELLRDPSRVDSLGDAWTTVETPLVGRNDVTAAVRLVGELESGRFADSLFALFGRPGRPIGIVGARGQRAGRLGEYITSRDSISLSPSRMAATAQLRHAFTHELAHRWQRRHADLAAAAWGGVGPIRDSLRYGFGNPDEHQAEALAFAVHFLQATARGASREGAAQLLDAYERLVPGTRAMARMLLKQPVYQQHSLAGSPIEPAHAAERRTDVPADATYISVDLN